MTKIVFIISLIFHLTLCIIVLYFCHITVYNFHV